MAADTAQPDFSDGSMLALYPPPELAAELALPGGLPVDELHLTLAYTGHAVDVDPDALATAARTLAARGPVDAMVSGHARFTGGDKGDVVVALVDSAGLEDLRVDALRELGDRGISVPREHGFTAHITLAYLPPDEPDLLDRLDARPVTFDTVSAVHGDDRTDTEFNTAESLAHPIGPYARTAYAQGWAASGGPMTDRVRAGSVAAIRYAIDHQHDPDVLEATLRLGHLEGVWATVYARRDQLLADTLAAVLAAWRDAIAELELGGIVRWYRAGEGITESASDDAATQRAIDAARVLLHALPETRAYARLRQELRDGLVAAQTEGTVGALALAADQVGQRGFDHAAAYDHIHAALADLESTWADADGWLGRMVSGAAGDLGRRLAALKRSGGSYQDMLDAAEDVLGSGDVRSVSYIVDMAVHQSLTVGALDLWSREGVAQVDFFTAGDSRVCVACEQAESASPYDTGSAPHPPLHGGCRCTLAARNPIRLATLAPFLPQEVA